MMDTAHYLLTSAPTKLAANREGESAGFPFRVFRVFRGDRACSSGLRSFLEDFKSACASGGEVEHNSFPNIGCLHRAAKILRAADWVMIDFGDDVSGPEAFALGNAAFFDFGDNHALGCFHPKLLGHLRRQCLDGQSELRLDLGSGSRCTRRNPE